MSTISVQIVTYNSGQVIEECLKSLIDQNITLDKVVVVDNASGDDTISKVLKYKSLLPLVIIKNNRNAGFAEGHNQAINLTVEDYVLVLNPDVVLDSNYINCIVQYLEKNPSVGSACGKLLLENNLLDSTGLIVKKSRAFLDRGALEPDTLQYDTEVDVFGVSAAAGVYRRTMINDISYGKEFFDSLFFAYKEDLDVAWRARLFGWESRYVPDAKGFHLRGWGVNKKRSEIPIFVRRHSYINRYIMMYKNEQLSYTLLHLIYILTKDLSVLLYLLFKEIEVIKVWGKFIDNLNTIKRKRMWIQSKRRVAPREIYKYFK